jgi:FKBP-type peptidyl-prolyl cis-trans isomerase 2
MQSTQTGDQVLVHYVKRFDDGSEVSSRVRGREPLELTVGTAHPRLPGLGTGLVGLTPGQNVTVFVPAELAHGLRDPDRFRRLARTRFPAGRSLAAGKQVRVTDRKGRLRSVRVVKVLDTAVVVDLNHPRAGQGVEMSVELVAILAPGRGTGVAAS